MAQGFFVNSANCYGCKSCQVACANEKLLAPGTFIRRVRQINAPAPGGHAFVSMACNHCDEPACVANCPVGAYQKMDNGLVVQNHDVCIGCKTCIEACPFHAPAYDEATSTTFKCDGCANRQAAGDLPVCVVTCPSSNLVLDDMDSLPEGTDVKGQSDTAPNLRVALDADIDVAVFAAIDEAEGIVDTGVEQQ